MAKKKVKEEKEKSLEDLLWDCRCVMRGVGSSEKNRDSVIGLVFIKAITTQFNKRRQAILDEYADDPELAEEFAEEPDFYTSENTYFLIPEARWEYLVEKASSNDIAITIDTAMKEIETSNPVLVGAVPSNLYVGLNVRKETLKGLIDAINKIPDRYFDDEDVIGRIYEYFLRAYAAQGNKDDGEFYTPSSLVQLIVGLIEPFEGTVYDPCCGPGGMFIQSRKFIEHHGGDKKKISVIGQESNPDTWRLAKMNLAVRGISHDLGPYNASTFIEDLHADKIVDFIQANPPFNLKNWRTKGQLEDDIRWQGNDTPPVSNANYAWILHMVHHLNKDHGRAGFLLSNGALNPDTEEEKKIRKWLLEQDYVEAIMVMPREMFYTTDIGVTLWIVNMNKKAQELNGRQLRDRSGEVLFCDFRTWNTHMDEVVVDKGKKKKTVTFSQEQIDKVISLFQSWQSADTDEYEDIPELCKSATIGEIRENDYALAPSKYVEFVDHDLDIDFDSEMSRIQSEMRDLIEFEKSSQSKLEQAFERIGYGID